MKSIGYNPQGVIGIEISRGQKPYTADTILPLPTLCLWYIQVISLFIMCYLFHYYCYDTIMYVVLAKYVTEAWTGLRPSPPPCALSYYHHNYTSAQRCFPVIKLYCRDMTSVNDLTSHEQSAFSILQQAKNPPTLLDVQLLKHTATAVSHQLRVALPQCASAKIASKTARLSIT